VLGVTAVVLVFAGLGRRLGVVPFETGLSEAWASDLRTAALSATVARATAFVVLIRVVVDGLPGFEATARQVASLLAGLTLVVAGMRGLSRNDARRMAADLIVLQGGFLLMGLAAASALPASHSETAAPGGGAVAATALVLAISLTAAAGLLGVLLSLDPEARLQGLEDLSGLVRTHPLAAVCLSVCLLALAGVPPVAGFWGRWSVVLAALSAPAEATMAGAVGLDAGFVALTFAAVVGTLVAAVLVVRWLEPVLLVGPLSRPRPAARLAASAAGLAAVTLTAASLLPGDALRLFDGAVRRGPARTGDAVTRALRASGSLEFDRTRSSVRSGPAPAVGGPSVSAREPADLRRLEEPAAAPTFLDNVDPHRSGAPRAPAHER
jgi:NADH-quinone oxidoreductase subunit N